METLPYHKVYQVVWVRPLPYAEKDFGVIAAADQTDEIEVDTVYLDDGEIGQYRVVPVTEDVYLTYLAQPKARPQWVGKNTSFGGVRVEDTIRMNVMVQTFNLNEFYQFADTKLYMKAGSVGGVAASIIGFFGFGLVLSDPMKEVPAGVRPTPIPIEGYTPKGRGGK